MKNHSSQLGIPILLVILSVFATGCFWGDKIPEEAPCDCPNTERIARNTDWFGTGRAVDSIDSWGSGLEGSETPHVNVEFDSFERAFETTSGGLNVNPDDAILLGHHAYLAAAIGLPKNAREAIARAEELMPSNPEISYLKAYVQMLLDDPDGWAEPLEKAIELGYSKRQAANDPMFEKPTAISG